MIDVDTLRVILDPLRASLHRMVDEAIDQTLSATQQRQNEEETELSIVPGNYQPEFTYTFPGNERVTFSGGHWYEVLGPHGQLKMLLANGEVDIRRERREVYYVFARESGPENPLTAFECTQFTKTDAGQFGSIIPVSADPRKHLKAGMTLPPRYVQATVERADKLYSSVKDGPTLRFVVKEDDVEAMLTHGYYVAHLRHRF
jgi:hypothetical protein